MKKFYLSACIVASLFASCSSDSVFIENTPETPVVDGNIGECRGFIPTQGVSTIRLNTSADKLTMRIPGSKVEQSVDVVDGNVYVLSESNNIASFFDDNGKFVGSGPLRAASSPSLVTVETMAEEHDVEGRADEFISHFQEEKNGDAESFGERNFLYVSDGNPINLYPVYSNTAANITLGLFYYDKDLNVHEQDIWQMDEEWYAKGTKVSDRTYHYMVNATQTRGVTITLPKGTTFGFCFYTNYNKKEDGKTRYTHRDLNNCEAEHAQNGTLYSHFATYAEDGIVYLGIDDGHSKVNDYNDLILIFDPEKKILPEPTPEDIEEENEVPEIPTIIDDLIHVTNDFIDVEGRFRDPYPYIRINVPVKGQSEFIVDVTDFEPFVEKRDDIRIVTGGDVKTDNSGINVENDRPTVNVTVPDGTAPGIYQLKMELYPKAENYGELLEIINKMVNGEYDWDKLYRVISVAPVPAQNVPLWDMLKLTIGDIEDTADYTMVYFDATQLSSEDAQMGAKNQQYRGFYIPTAVVETSLTEIEGNGTFLYQLTGDGRKLYIYNSKKDNGKYLNGLVEATQAVLNGK